MLQGVTGVLQACYRVLQACLRACYGCVTVCFSMLHRVPVALHRTGVLQRVTTRNGHVTGVLQACCARVTGRCSALQRVTAHYGRVSGVLQHVTAHYSALRARYGVLRTCYRSGCRLCLAIIVHEEASVPRRFECLRPCRSKREAATSTAGGKPSSRHHHRTLVGCGRTRAAIAAAPAPHGAATCIDCKRRWNA